MTPKVLYRSAAVLLLVFATLHTIGFNQIDPAWGVDDAIAKLRASTFLAQGQTRSYWDFYLGFGYTVTAWLVLAAVMAWELGGTSAPLPMVRWGLVAMMTANAWLSWRFFFPAPVVCSLLITAGLAGGAYRTRSIARA